MISYLLAGPAEEPVSLAEAKAFLKCEDSIEDGLITTLIGAARLHVEGVTGKALLAQSWRVVLDEWPETRVLRLPMAPLLALSGVVVFDPDGVGHAIAPAQLTVEPDRLIVPAGGAGLPGPRERQGIEIDYVAGFGTVAAAVPADLKQAMLGLIAHWHAHRDAVVIAGSGAIVPAGFERLIAAHKRVRL